MTGNDRALLYRLAVETGLRASELRSLTDSTFNIGGTAPTVTIAAAYAKNRRQDTLPLKPETAALLREGLKNKAPSAQAFSMPIIDKVARMVRADLADARVKWIEAAGSPDALGARQKSKILCYRDESGRVADFHAFRHTFISNLVAAGVHPKTAQLLARHSTITLTMDRYTHVANGALTSAVNSLPNLDGESPAPEKIPATAGAPSPAFLSPGLSPSRDLVRPPTEFHGGINKDRKDGFGLGKTDENRGFRPPGRRKYDGNEGRTKTALKSADSKSISRAISSTRISPTGSK
jgi:hypothetical protein